MIHELQRTPIPSSFRPAMVDCLRHCGIRDHRVLTAMASVPRISFMIDHNPANAHAPQPLSRSYDQPVAGSYMIARMLEALQLEPWHRVLEIGTGSGYSTAVLSRLVREVYSIERIPELAESARARLAALGDDGIVVRCADGAMGWPTQAPYDAIFVGASAPSIPPALLEQLAEGGRLVMPVGDAHRQRLVCVAKTGGAATSTYLGPARFAPLVDARADQRENQIDHGDVGPGTPHRQERANDAA